MHIELGRPVYLLVLLLVPLVWWALHGARRGPLPWPDRLALLLRIALIAALALVLTDPRWVTAVKGRATVFLQDISESIPSASRTEAAELINWWMRDRDPLHEDVSYVVFADGTGIETPFHGLGGLRPEDIRPMDPTRVGSLIERGETDIQAALKAAEASFPPGVGRRIVLLTDGIETRGGAEETVRDLVSPGSGVEVLVYPLRYKRPNEVLVEKVVAPPRARSGQPVPVRAVVVSTEDGVRATVRFTDEEGRGISSSDVTLRKGRNVYPITLQFEKQGLHPVHASVEAAGDGDAANNHGTAAVFAEGSPAVLVAAKRPEEGENIRKALAAHELFVDLVPLSSLPQEPGALSAYECVVLVNAPAAEMSSAQMRMLRAAVEDTGLGLVAVGGPESFTAGAWGGTPLEEVLPVSMDVSQKRVLPNGACVVVLHTCEFAQGNDWARTIAKAVVRTLGRNDWYGCVDFEGSDPFHWVVPVSRGDRGAMVSLLDRANPMDMPSLHECVKAGVEALEGTNAYLKHMIVISDGDPAMPDDALVKRMVDDGITISAVAIAQHGAQDMMKPMTEATGGRYYALNEGEVKSLPAIFMKEASTVRRSAVFEEPFQPQVAAVHEVLKGIQPAEIPPLGGYVVTSSKDRAENLLLEPKNGDPVLAIWRKGLGVTAAFTSDLSGRWGKQWLGWDKYDKLVTQLVRACSRGVQRSTFGLSVEASGGTGRTVVEAVDAQGNYVDGLAFEGVVIAPSGESRPLRVLQVAQGRYEATFPAVEPGLYLVSLQHEVPGGTPDNPARAQVRAALPVDYSPEHLALESDEAFFARLQAAGAKVLTREDRPFLAAMPETRSLAEAWRWVLLAAVLLFPFEVAARRLRLDPAPLVARVRERLAGVRKRLPEIAPGKVPVVVTTDALATAGKAGEAAGAAADAAASPAGEGGAGSRPAPAPGAPPVAPGASDDLLKAKRRAKKQTRWEDSG
jgi:uncharacterized membrane protein